MPRSAFLLALSLTLAAPTAGLGRTWYITPDGTGDAPTIQAGVDSSAVGDTVLVAPGLYPEQGIPLPPGILIRGDTNDPSSVVIQGDGSARIFTATGSLPDVSFQMLTIADGDAGGGAGGGIALHGSASFHRVVFLRNRGVSGGAIFLRDGGVLTVSECEFRDNRGSPHGGAIYVFNGVHAIISDSLFDGNEVDSSLGGFGGAIYVRWHGAVARIERCVFTGNRALSLTSGGAVYVGLYAWCTISDSVFEDNVTDLRGAAIHILQAGAASVTGCSFRNNTARWGGGLSIYGTHATVESCLFEGNTASESGGGVWNQGVLTLSSSTFWGNSAAVGGGVSSPAASTIADHTLLAFNEGGGAASGEVWFHCSDLFGNAGGDWTGFIGEGNANENGNLSADPLFCGPGNGDFTIHSASACAPPGVTGCGLIGALPVGCGPVSIEEWTWGWIKAAHR